MRYLFLVCRYRPFVVLIVYLETNTTNEQRTGTAHDNDILQSPFLHLNFVNLTISHGMAVPKHGHIFFCRPAGILIY